MGWIRQNRLRERETMAEQFWNPLQRLTVLLVLLFVGLTSGSNNQIGSAAVAGDQPATEPAATSNSGTAEPAAPSVSRPAPSNEQLAATIRELSAADYDRREAASEQLAAWGAAAVPALARAVDEGTVESSARALKVLGQQWVDGDEPLRDQIEPLLEQWAASSRFQLAKQAGGLLAANLDIRESRAVAAIRRLGGKVQYRAELANSPQFRSNTTRSLSYVAIGKKWQGGVDGLKYIRRLERLPHLFIVSPDVVSAEVAQTTFAETSIKWEFRGSAFLGITFDVVPVCRVNDVNEGSPAALGGLRRGDQIIQVNDIAVDTANSLKEILEGFQPGDVVKMLVERDENGEYLERTLEVRLGSWED